MLPGPFVHSNELNCQAPALYFSISQHLSSSVSNRSTVKLTIRKVQYAPESEGEAPCVETTKDFLMSEKALHVKASLDKEVGAFV